MNKLETQRSKEEIYEGVDEALAYKNDETTKFPALTYEHGVIAMYEWLFLGGDNPMADESSKS